MNEEQFAELKEAVRMMARHGNGEQVPGMRVTEVSEASTAVVERNAELSENAQHEHFG